MKYHVIHSPSENSKSDGTLISQTFEVEEKKMPSIFLIYNNFDKEMAILKWTKNERTIFLPQMSTIHPFP